RGPRRQRPGEPRVSHRPAHRGAHEHHVRGRDRRRLRHPGEPRHHRTRSFRRRGAHRGAGRAGEPRLRARACRWGSARGGEHRDERGRGVPPRSGRAAATDRPLTATHRRGGGFRTGGGPRHRTGWLSRQRTRAPPGSGTPAPAATPRERSEAGVFEPEEALVTGPDGYPVHGWVTTPNGEGPHPVLLLIHGGPHAAYSPTFFDEVQVYTEAGYAVVFCNPRGSSSYGQEHGRAITGRLGTVDAKDVIAFLDGVLERRADLDPGRVGVLGGSYGGYLTGWLTTRTDRWAGAIVERGFLDAFSFEGSSDIGWFSVLRYLGDDRELVEAQNPMSHIDKVTTPTLVIHSEEDWRCPIEQGQRWFVGLKRRGVPAEFLVFSGEGHELSRSGTPKHRVARFEHILRWWATHLPTSGNPAAATPARGES